MTARDLLCGGFATGNYVTFEFLYAFKDLEISDLLAKFRVIHTYQLLRAESFQVTNRDNLWLLTSIICNRGKLTYIVKQILYSLLEHFHKFLKNYLELRLCCYVVQSKSVNLPIQQEERLSLTLKINYVNVKFYSDNGTFLSGWLDNQ